MNRELSIVTWKNVRADVLKVNKELGEIIDAISPGDEYKFVQAKYLYGDIYVKNSEVQLPIDNELIPLSHSAVDKKIQEALNYSSIPLLLGLDKDSELFVNAGKRIIPINLFHKGELPSTYETMDYMTGRTSQSEWNLCAGSCSIFMLPKITDRFGFKKLHVEYNIPTTLQIKKLTDHWELFRTLAQSKNFTQNWQSTILFFSKKWFDKKNVSKEWCAFKDYLLRVTWERAGYSIDKIRFNMFWEKFAKVISLRRLHPNPYLLDQIKHLLSIIINSFPAFTVINDSQNAAPTELLQKIFVETFDLKKYLPTIMHACMPNDAIIKPQYVYYSLNIPTVLDGSPLKKTTSTIVNDLREIMFILDALKNSQDSQKQLKELNSIIYAMDISCFHYKIDLQRQTKVSENIPIEDSSFLNDNKLFPNRMFCATSPFFSGCIRIKTQAESLATKPTKDCTKQNLTLPIITDLTKNNANYKPKTAVTNYYI